jgi:hypothetical protein
MTSELQNMQQKPIVDFRKFLQERFDKASPRRQLAKDETTKLEGIAEKLKRGENVQNRQLQTWLSEDEYAQVDIEWQEQLELRGVIFLCSTTHGGFQKCNPLVISVCVLVSYMAAVEVLVMDGVRAVLKVNTLGNRRLLSVTSSLLPVQYLNWVHGNEGVCGCY